MTYRIHGFKLAVLLAVLFLAACGGESNFTHSTVGGGNDGPPPSTRFDDAPDLGPGETIPGLHLRPGVEVFSISEQQLAQATFSPEDRTLTMPPALFEEFLAQHDEIWSGDVIIGEDFVVRVDHIRSDGTNIIIDLFEFELFDVIYGDWTINLATGEESGDAGTRRQPLESENGERNSFSFGDLFTFEGELNIKADFAMPVNWVDQEESRFEGRITVNGHGVNPEYDCNSYTRVTRHRRYWIVGPTVEVVEEIEPENFCIDYLLLYGTLGLEASVGLEFKDVFGGLDISDDKKIKLGKFPSIPLGATPFTISVDPFFKGEYEFKIGAMLEKLSVSMDRSIVVPIGFEVERGADGEHSLAALPNEQFPVRDQMGDPVLTMEGAKIGAFAGVAAHVGFEFGLHAGQTSLASAGISGPSITLKAALEAELLPFQEPCLSVEYYLQVESKSRLQGELNFGRYWSWKVGIIDGVNSWKSPKWMFYDYKSDGELFCDPEAEDPQRIDRLKITLEWDSETDLDLWLLMELDDDPGEIHVINYERISFQGGEYRGDSCIQGCVDGGREVIEWTNSAPPPGFYVVDVINYNGAAPANFTVTVETNHGVLEHVTGVSHVDFPHSANVVQFEVPNVTE